MNRAVASLHDVPVSGRDQIEALVADVCRDPSIGVEDLLGADDVGPARVAVAGLAVVFYQVIEDVKIVRVVRVAWRV
jgi:hypothetical protein